MLQREISLPQLLDERNSGPKVFNMVGDRMGKQEAETPFRLS